MTEFLSNPIVRNILVGVVAAAAVDIAAFRKFQSLDEFAAYNWRVAGSRWAMGAVAGLLGSTVSILD